MSEVNSKQEIILRIFLILLLLSLKLENFPLKLYFYFNLLILRLFFVLIATNYISSPFLISSVIFPLNMCKYWEIMVF